jgi:RHH-type proline utilization regulon transcriptional repressor/proline dehydrogenase/delta 1-pyrroline-5-carboxylate dehydrogenase
MAPDRDEFDARLTAARVDMTARHLAPEPALLTALLPAAQPDPASRARIIARARRLIEATRKSTATQGGLEPFLQEYRLSGAEGIVMLTLAESLLRVPDQATKDDLIRDKLAQGDWRSHLGASPSRMVNLASRALTFSREWVEAVDGRQGVLARLLARGGEPLLRNAVSAAMSIMAGRFVMGQTIEEAIEKMDRRFRYSFDMLGEAALTKADAARYHDAYRHAIHALGTQAPVGGNSFAAPDISIKLSALHPRYEESQRSRALPELADRLLDLAVAARDAGLSVAVDAEEAERLDLSLDVIAKVLVAPELAGYEHFGIVVQAYQKRARPVIEWAAALALARRTRLRIRLVKGAYWDAEIKAAQERGLDGYPVFTRKAATDVSYLACARALLSAPQIFPAFATHNALTVATLLDWTGPRRDFEFQRLLGMGVGLYESLIEEQGLACRIYAPVGTHGDLLAYLARRLLENGANTSFVNQATDPRTSIDDLLADPVAHIEAVGGTSHPRIPLPRDLFGDERRNSHGIDLRNPVALSALSADLDRAFATSHDAAPLIEGRAVAGQSRPVSDPADRRRLVGTIVEATETDVERAMVAAARGSVTWSSIGVEQRAACLERAADLMERNRVPLMALVIREAGKTIPDAFGEVREAVDFCRYYAGEARRRLAPLPLPGPTGESNLLSYAGRGVFVCVSPWNFPLAIFIGQVAAALVAGNAVVAKPAPQTPLIAYRAVQLLHEAGIPPEALHLLPGGAEIGKRLVADPRTAGVAFTGSTAAARTITQALAAREGGPIVPLIAETGGQNAMIVDSTALPEQVVRDVVTSAFRSTGQRCSALRVLFLQEDIAPALIEMLEGAMSELVVGDPSRVETDVGPVIDDAARGRLQTHLASNIGTMLCQVPLGNASAFGSFFPPTLLAIDDIARLKSEVFGPIAHVVRWRGDRLDDVIEAVNATGYGLTLGIHSRIGKTVENITRRARVGNVYVNRSMIGAVVGAQPFGGEGLSGTGPKAGGPNYLPRFVTERTLSVDTTAAGGNSRLLSLAEDG